MKSADQVYFMEGAIEGMQQLQKMGYRLVLATNQTYLGTPKHPQQIFDERFVVLGDLV